MYSKGTIEKQHKKIQQRI